MLIGLARKMQLSCTRRGQRVISSDVHICNVLSMLKRMYLLDIRAASFCKFLFLMSRDTFVFCGDMFMND